VTRITAGIGTIQGPRALNQVKDEHREETTMRIISPSALASVAATRGRDPRPTPGRRSLLRRLNAYTLWAFNPQRELTSRYDRAA
jgi:hypothetical protein